ncbi:unnamed protein product [Ectocarpus sp. 8 AP-2014]
MRFTVGTRVRIHSNGILINGDHVPDQTRTLLRSWRCCCVGVEDGYDTTSKLLSRGVRSVDSVQLAGSAVGGWAQEIPRRSCCKLKTRWPCLPRCRPARLPFERRIYRAPWGVLKTSLS